MSKLKKRSLPVAGAAGLAGAVVLTALLLLPLALAIHRELLGRELGASCAIGAAGLSVAAAVWIIAKGRGRQALATGGIVALGYVLLAALFCALGGEGSTFGGWLLYLTGAAFAGGLAGAVLSIRQNPHRKKRR